MNALRELLRRVWLMVRRDRATRDLEDEMRLHVQFRAEALRTRGMSDADARAAAARQFGNIGATSESARDEWGFGSVDDLVRDVRYAARRLCHRPGFALSVVGVLALGIGATTAMFSAVDAAMLRPLPFTRPRELVALRNMSVPVPTRGVPQNSQAEFTILDALAMKETFANVAAYATGGINLSDGDRPRRLKAGVVTTDFFVTLGVLPERGRAFAGSDVVPGAARAVVLSWGLWQSQFGGADVVATTISLNDKPYEIVGVRPQGLACTA